MADFDGANQVLARFWNDDAGWDDLVDARVSGVEPPLDLIEAHFSFDLAL